VNGQQEILKMRRNGFKPAYVWLQDSGLAPTDYAVTLAKTDNPATLDLRFLVGTTVLAESDNRQRLSAMLKACMAAKAARVITNLHQKADAWHFEVLETTDTEGVMTWPK
jgi:hypothetical protein